MKVRLPGLVTPYSEARVAHCAYELSLGSEVYVTGKRKTKHLLKDDEQFVIPPGQFADLLTEEKVQIPEDALGFISIKFSLKKRGLVNVSGFHVDPGYSSQLLFSVYNAGPTSIIVARGSPLFLLWYCALDDPTTDLYNKSRSSITTEDVSDLQGDVASPQALANRVEKLESRVAIGSWLAALIVAALIGAWIAGFRVSRVNSTSQQRPPSLTSTTLTKP
ncbi:MAG: dCTP deaminase [Acidimicrobiaceae bacterium]|nr:dCTP deaminase [Acidimicrobiaceae bacterium]